MLNHVNNPIRLNFAGNACERRRRVQLRNRRRQTSGKLPVLLNSGEPNYTTGVTRVRANCRSGFTMLEMILVLTIAIVVAALAVPAVQGTIGNQAIASGADRVRVAMGQARVQAIRTGDVYAFFYRRNGQWYDVAPLADHRRLTGQLSSGQSPSNHERELSDNWLPRQVFFVAAETLNDARSESTREASDGAPIDAILFYPDGTAQDARILLQDERSRTMAVELRGLTGMTNTIRKVNSNGQGSGAR